LTRGPRIKKEKGATRRGGTGTKERTEKDRKKIKSDKIKGVTISKRWGSATHS